MDVLSISSRTGRLFENTDRHGSPPVALVNRAAAQRFWAGEDPVGKRINAGVQFGYEQDEWLGARIREVIALVVWQGIRLGLIGVIGAIAGGRVIGGLLFDGRPHDPMTFAGVTLLLLTVVGVACMVRALRAGRIPPASA